MSVLDEVRGANESYVSQFDKGDLPMPPGGSSPSSPAWTRGSTRPGLSASRRETRT